MRCRRIEHGYNNRTCDDHLRCSVLKSTYYIVIVLLSARWGKQVGRLFPTARASYASTRIVPLRAYPKYYEPIPDNEQNLPRPAGHFSFSSRTAIFSQDAFSSLFDSFSSSSTHCWPLAQFPCGADISQRTGTRDEVQSTAAPRPSRQYTGMQCARRLLHPHIILYRPRLGRQRTDDALLQRHTALDFFILRYRRQPPPPFLNFTKMTSPRLTSRSGTADCDRKAKQQDPFWAFWGQASQSLSRVHAERY